MLFNKLSVDERSANYSTVYKKYASEKKTIIAVNKQTQVYNSKVNKYFTNNSLSMFTKTYHSFFI